MKKSGAVVVLPTTAPDLQGIADIGGYAGK